MQSISSTESVPHSVRSTAGHIRFMSPLLSALFSYLYRLSSVLEEVELGGVLALAGARGLASRPLLLHAGLPAKVLLRAARIVL